MDTPEISRFTIFCKSDRLRVIHMFRDMMAIGRQGIDEEQVDSVQEIDALCWDLGPRISRIADTARSVADDKPATVHGRVIYENKGQGQSE
jgi:hypothetical protein